MDRKKGLYERIFKRPMDFILSLIAVLLLSPIMLIIAILVKIKLGSPVIFAQQRPGLNEKIFKMYKFRTMTDEKDKDGNLLPDSIRLTSFGRLLRSTSLDELPELWNIIKGDMSIIGPRPQLIIDMVFMTDEQRTRHAVVPGLTGLAQVNGRNNISWGEKLEYDKIYCNSISFVNDIKIFYKTIVKVLKKEGVSSKGMQTAEDLGDYLFRNSIVTQEYYIEKMEEAKKLSDISYR